LLELYQAADVFVVPAVGEIFTLVMQEAMACGLPVVTTDDPGYAEYDLDLESIALVPRTTEAIDAAVTAVLADAARAARMSAYSRAVALDRFSWRQNYAGEYGVYAEHLARTSAS
jgi:D-inositol-3-phosphate glycosyltransferase